MRSTRFFESILPHTCTIQEWTSSADDSFGQPTKTWAATGTSVPCRLMTSEIGRPFESVRQQTGEVVVAEYLVFFALSSSTWDSTNKRPAFSEQARFVFTAPWNITLNPILVGVRTRGDRDHHLEVLCNRGLA